MHHNGALITDGGKKMVNDFATMLPYSPTFFPSDHQNRTTKVTVSFTNPICKPNFTTNTTDDLSILMVQHQDLLSRHKNCLSHLQTTFKEIETLRQENTNLRAANCDLNNRLNFITRAYLQNNYASMISSGSGSSIPCPDHLDSADPISTNIEKFSGLHIDEGNSGAARCEGCESPASSLGNDLAEKDADRVSLPKSISVRSNGFLKVGQVSATPAGITSLPPNRVAKRTRSLVPVNAPVPQKVHVWGKNKKGEAIEVEVYSQGTSKTELCNKWQESGKCPYGENCEFAHGIEELRPVLRHPRYKTEVCRMVLSSDGCPYGHRCHFRHALTEQQNLTPPPLNLD